MPIGGTRCTRCNGRHIRPCGRAAAKCVIENAGTWRHARDAILYLRVQPWCDRMNGMTSSSTEPERGRIARPRKGAHEHDWRRWIPGIEMLRRYEVIWLRNDIMAGLVLTTMLIPVGVAYAVASGVP